MKYLVYYILLLLMISCKKEKFEKPILLSNTNTLFIQNFQLKFKTNYKNWKAYLLNFNQPIALNSSFKNGILYVSYTTQNINIESDGRIVLINDDTCFNYLVNIKNHSNSLQTEKDYRSPKTVNPDSSLHHDKIYYVLDEGQNIQTINNQIFVQQQVVLEPKASKANAIATNNLSAFYVQPGSITAIQLKVTKDTLQKNYIVSTNILKDKHNNVVANGTKICFEGKLNNSLTKSFAPTINGIATIFLPIAIFKNSSLSANSNNINSNIVILN